MHNTTKWISIRLYELLYRCMNTFGEKHKLSTHNAMFHVKRSVIIAYTCKLQPTLQ